MNGVLSRTIINVSILVVVVAWAIFWASNSITILYNTYFTPCENNFLYDHSSKSCDCLFPFYGTLCEKNQCENGALPERTTNGWKCKCIDRWFGKRCTLCGTHDSAKNTCLGALPWPNSELCSSIKHNTSGALITNPNFEYLFGQYKFDGEVDFFGNNCQNICLKVEGTKSITGDAFKLYRELKDNLLDNPMDLIGCPDAMCYGCTGEGALCIDGAVKSRGSNECNVICEPCDDVECKPCNHKGNCILRGQNAVCQCQRYARGLTCEKICPGVSEVYNGITTTLTGPECYGFGQCNDNAECICEEDPEGTPLFIENCRFRCPTANGIVCGGHGTCQMKPDNSSAECICEDSWFNPQCSCSDGSAEFPKTCIHGECNVDTTGCNCHDDNIKGHWDGPFCSLCQQHWFTEKTFCLQYCNPETTCEGNAEKCVVRNFVVSENAEDIFEPCQKVVTDGEVQLVGTCALCDCQGNYDTQITEMPVITTQSETESLAYQCGNCKSDFYPKTTVVSADPQVEKCSVECNYGICNERGACMLDSGDCTCHGSCESDASKYSGQCLMKPASDTEFLTIQPRFVKEDRCATCETNFQPNITGGSFWNSSCVYYCNPTFTEESTFPAICKLSDGTIREECVFCSGKAESCSQTGLPSCNCFDGFAGTYCQSTCSPSGSANSCINGQCLENALSNFFDLGTLPYERTSNRNGLAPSYECKCNPQDEYSKEERDAYEEFLYVITRYDLLADVFSGDAIDISKTSAYFGNQCFSSCKTDFEGSVCSGRGNCVTYPLTGLSNLDNCNTDNDCNVLDGTTIEDQERFCHFEKIPKYWQYVKTLQNFQLSSCNDEEISWIKKFIDNYDWDRYCYNYISTSVPPELNTMKCSTCTKLTDKSLWQDIATKCTDVIRYTNYEALEELSQDCSLLCKLSIGDFDWKRWCVAPREDFQEVCPDECLNKFQDVDWVTDNGFCADVENYTYNTKLQESACKTFEDTTRQSCEQVDFTEATTEYEEVTPCFIEKESILSTTTRETINQPYAGVDNQRMCENAQTFHPQVCGTTEYTIPYTKRNCNSNSIPNFRDTGLSDCELTDAEHQYCSASFPNGWSTFPNSEGHQPEYVVLIGETEINNPPTDFVYTTNSNLAIKVNNVTSVKQNFVLKAAAIVTYEVNGNSYIGTLVGQCELTAPLCLSCGSQRTLKDGTGASIDIQNKTATNYNPNPKQCCSANSYFQQSVDGTTFWCHEGGTYGVDYCAHDRCVNKIREYNWEEKIDQIRTLEYLGLSGKLTSLQDPSTRDSFNLHSYCTSRQATDEVVAASDISFGEYKLYCQSFGTTPPTQANAIHYFTGTDDLPEQAALFVEKQSWWNGFLSTQMDELGIPEQSILMPTNVGGKIITSTSTENFISDNDSYFISMWVFVPFDKYRYVLDIQIKNAYNEILSRLQLRQRRFIFNYVNTGFELSATSISEGFWFHIEQTILNNEISIILTGAGRTQTIRQNAICQNTCSIKQISKIEFSQPEKKNTALVVHDMRVLYNSDNVKGTYLYNIFSNNDLSYSNCDTFLAKPVDIEDVICLEKYDNVTECNTMLTNDVAWAETCTNLLEVYAVSDDDKELFCGQDNTCLTEVNNFLTTTIDSWVEDFILHATMPTQMNISECTENLQCKQAFYSYSFADYCIESLRDLYTDCSDCGDTFRPWRQNFNKKEFCDNLYDAENEAAATLKAGLASCTNGCTSMVDDMDFTEFCVSRLSSHDVFAPHALSHNISAYCRDQIFITLPQSLSNNEDRKLDYETDCTSLGTYGSVNVYTENGVQKSGQCRKVDCECTEIGLSGDRCNINCPISSFDNSACNEKTGLGKCCAEPNDGTEVSPSNCVTDILTNSFTLTNIGSCVCYNSGTDDVISGFNCEEKCKKCNLENGRCSPATGTCLCVNNAYRTSIRSSLLGIGNTFSDFNLMDATEVYAKYGGYIDQSKTFSTYIYAKKYCESLNDCVGISKDNVSFNVILKSASQPSNHNSIVSYVSIYVPEVREADEDNNDVPIIFDWANKETEDGTTYGDQSIQVNVLLLFSPEDSCTNILNGDNIDKCCTWTNFTNSNKNPFRATFDATAIPVSDKVSWPSTNQEVRISDYAKNAEPTNIDSVTSRFYQTIYESKCPSYRLVNGRYRVEYNKNNTSWQPLPVSTSKFVMFKNQWCLVKAYQHNNIEYEFDESKFNFGLISKIECPQVKSIETTTHGQCLFPFFITKFNELTNEFVIEEIRDCTDSNIINGYPGKEVVYSADGLEIVETLYDFASIKSSVATATGILNPTYCVTKPWFQNITEYIERIDKNLTSKTCRKNTIGRNKCTNAVRDLQEGNCLCGTETCNPNEYCYTKIVEDQVINECHSCSNLMSPAPETCCELNEYLQYQDFGPRCVAETDSKFRSYCINEYGCPMNSARGLATTHIENEILLENEDLNAIKSRIENKHSITISDINIDGYTPITRTVPLSCTTGFPNADTSYLSVHSEHTGVETDVACDDIVIDSDVVDAYIYQKDVKKCTFYLNTYDIIAENTVGDLTNGDVNYEFCKKTHIKSVPLCGEFGSACAQCPCITNFVVTSSTHYFDTALWYAKGTGAHPEYFCDLNSCWDYIERVCKTDCNCNNNILPNAFNVLKTSTHGALVGGHDYFTYENNILSVNNGRGEYDAGNIPIDFLRICKDVQASVIDNSDMTPNVEEDNIFDENEFIRNDKASASNPSYKCGDDCTLTCPGSNSTTGVPCNGRGVCNVDCSCSCFSFSSYASRAYFIKESKEGQTIEVPSYAVGGASAFQSPFRGEACEATCPGWSKGMIGYQLPSDEDKDFIMNELICSGKGTCLLNNKGTSQCACEQGYVSGIDGNCEFICPGAFTAEGTCGGHGTCSVKYTGATANIVEDLIRVNVDLQEEEDIVNIVVLNGKATMTLVNDKLMGLYQQFEIGPEGNTFGQSTWSVSEITSSKEYVFDVPSSINDATYSGGLKLYDSEYLNYNPTDKYGTASFKMTSFITETSTDGETYLEDFYVSNKGKQSTDSLITTVKFISVCPESHPYVYHHGMYCCGYKFVANGTTINKRSAIQACSSTERMRCPTINWYKRNTLMVQKLIEQKPSFQDGDEVLINIEDGNMESNRFTDNPDHYTCDPDINLVKIDRELRPLYDTWGVFELSTGITENLLFKYRDTTCSHIRTSELNLNGLSIQNQPQTIRLLQCSACSCEKSSKQGFWDGLNCENCQFGFAGDGCKNQCNGVCGKIQLGQNEIWYEEYQRAVGITDPCVSPESTSGLFYGCPQISDIELIFQSTDKVFQPSYKRSVYCLDGVDSPGSCVTCPEPLVGNIDLRFPNNPDRVCQLLDCPLKQQKMFSVGELDFTEYSNHLYLSTFYEHKPWPIYGPPKELFTEINSFDKTVAIDMFDSECPSSHPNELGNGECCSDNGKIMHTYNIPSAGLYNNFTGPLIKSKAECATLAMQSYRNSKGLFNMRSGDCYVYQGMYSFDTRYIFPLSNVVDWHQSLIDNTKDLVRLTTNTDYQNWIAYFDCPIDERIQKTLNTFATIQSSGKTISVSKTYETACEYDLNGDLIQNVDLYEDSSTEGLTFNTEDKVNSILTNRCLEKFYDFCREGHEQGIQNPFLTWHAFKNVQDHVYTVWPSNQVESNGCRWHKVVGKIFCPHCPFCEYSGTYPNLDLQVNNETCDIAYFPYCGQHNYTPETKLGAFVEHINTNISPLFASNVLKEFLEQEANESVPDKHIRFDMPLHNKYFLNHYGEYLQCQNTSDCVTYNYLKKKWSINENAERVSWGQINREKDTINNVHYPYFKKEVPSLAVDLPNMKNIIGKWTEGYDTIGDPREATATSAYRKELGYLCYEHDNTLNDATLINISNRETYHGNYSSYKQLLLDIECPNMFKEVNTKFATMVKGELINTVNGIGLTKLINMGQLTFDSTTTKKYGYFYDGVVILDRRILTTAYVIDENNEIDYETAIKPYCYDNDLHSRKFTGKCLDLKNAAIDGNIYLRHTSTTTYNYYKLQQLQTDLPIALKSNIIIEQDVAILAFEQGKYYNVVQPAYHETFSSSEALPVEVPFRDYNKQQCRGSSQDLHRGKDSPFYNPYPKLNMQLKNLTKSFGVPRGFAPTCYCSVGHSNTRYSFYNQPFELQHSTLSSKYDPDQHLLQRNENLYGTAPFKGCLFSSLNGTTEDDPNVECASLLTQFNNGIYDPWVRLNSAYFYSQVETSYDSNGRPYDPRATKAQWTTTGCYGCDNGYYQNEAGQSKCKVCPAGKFYSSIDNPWKTTPMVTSTMKIGVRRKYINFMSSNFEPECTLGKYIATINHGEFKLEHATLNRWIRDNDLSNPEMLYCCTDGATGCHQPEDENNNRFIQSDFITIEEEFISRGDLSIYPYEWWKIPYYPSPFNEWHDVDEWVMGMKGPRPMYYQDTQNMWLFDSMINLDPVVDVYDSPVFDSHTTSCFDCPDNWASVPFDDTYNYGDKLNRFPSFNGTERIKSGNKNCLICPPGYDTGAANHLVADTVDVADTGNLPRCPVNNPFLRKIPKQHILKRAVTVGKNVTAGEVIEMRMSVCCKTRHIHQDEEDTTFTDTEVLRFMNPKAYSIYAANFKIKYDDVPSSLNPSKGTASSIDDVVDLCYGSYTHFSFDSSDSKYICVNLKEYESVSLALNGDTDQADVEKTAGTANIYYFDGCKYCSSGSTNYVDDYVYYEKQSSGFCSEEEHIVTRAQCETAAKVLGYTYTEADLTWTTGIAQTGCFMDGSSLFYFENNCRKSSDSGCSSRDAYTGRTYLCAIQTNCRDRDESALQYGLNVNLDITDYRTSCNGIWDPKIYRLKFENFAYLDNSNYGISISIVDMTLVKCANRVSMFFNRHASIPDALKIFEYDSLNEICMVFVSTTMDWDPDTYPKSENNNVAIYALNPEISGITSATCLTISFLDSYSKGSATCRRCPIGKYNSRAGSNCLPCPPGQYADTTALDTCKVCPKGKYAYGAGSSHCDLCPPGQYVSKKEDGNTLCLLCQAGKYQDEAEQETCKDCPSGKVLEKNYYHDTLDAGKLRIKVNDWSTYNGQLKYYNSMFDYSGVHGVADRDTADGFFIEGYSPVFEFLRNRQAESHDEASDCVACPAGSYYKNDATLDAPYCEFCPAGKYTASAGAGAVTSCVGTCDKDKVLRYVNPEKDSYKYLSYRQFTTTADRYAEVEKIRCVPEKSKQIFHETISEAVSESTFGMDEYKHYRLECNKEPSCNFLEVTYYNNYDGNGGFWDATFYETCEVLQYSTSGFGFGTIENNMHWYKRSNEFINLNYANFRALEGKPVLDNNLLYYKYWQGWSFERHIGTEFFTGEELAVTHFKYCFEHAFNNGYHVFGNTISSTGQRLCIYPYRADEFMNKFARLALPDDKPFKDFGYHDYGLVPTENTNAFTVYHIKARNFNVRFEKSYEDSPGCTEDDTDCNYGVKYEQRNPGLNTCMDCPTGFFANSNGTCQNCDPGYKVYRPNANGPRACTACTGSTYQDEYGDSTTCKDWTVCDEGTKFGGESTTVAGSCTNCPVGKYQDETSHRKDTCKDCETGKYTSTVGTSSCTTWSNCGSGYYFVDGSASADRTCEACAEGKYQDEIDHKIKNCKICAAGTYASTTGLDGCENCQAGQYQNLNGQSGCKDCEAGQWQNSAGQTSCKGCSEGRFTDTAAQTSCKWCAMGYIQGSSSFTGTSCTACPTGKESGNCQQSYIGTQYESYLADCLTYCDHCQAGFYGDVVGLNNCKACPNGKYQPFLTSSSCKNCPAGKQGKAGDYTRDNEATSCTSCGAGKYQNSAGQTSCKNCIKGTYSTTTGGASVDVCQYCPNGKYGDQTGADAASDCKACPTGKGTTTVGNDASSDCRVCSFSCGSCSHSCGTGSQTCSSSMGNDCNSYTQNCNTHTCQYSGCRFNCPSCSGWCNSGYSCNVYGWPNNGGCGGYDCLWTCSYRL